MEDTLDAMELWLQSRMEQVHTAIPGRIQSYNPDTRLAVVKPSVLPKSMHADTFDIPPIADVPVVWPGTGEFTLEGNLSIGDGVLLLFTEAGIGNWLQSSADAPAEDQTRFSLQDAIAIPGLFQPSRKPLHPARGAAWGMRGESVSIGATRSGKAVLSTEAGSLRSVLEALQNILPAMDAQLTELNAAVPGYISQAVSIVNALDAIREVLE